jgi:hypothetical protein
MVNNMNIDLFIKRVIWRKRVKEWRRKNPEKYLIMNCKHQLTWRTKNVDLNRYRARIGMRAKKMYNDLLQLMKG